MKRSEINSILSQTRHFFSSQNVHLPPWADYAPEAWSRLAGDRHAEIAQLKLGWDVTTFGAAEFNTTGLTLFTLRNGLPAGSPWPKSYAEKVMHVREGQVTPLHYHPHKREDIINRGGGNLIITLHNPHGDALATTNVCVAIDGVRQRHAPGAWLRLAPGESISLDPGLWHSFWGEAGFGDVLVGEVSSPNDDEHDNAFLTPIARFNQIVEDEPARWLLCSEYPPVSGDAAG